MESDFERKYANGASLYGDDFDSTALEQWYAAEELGYYKLAMNEASIGYQYHALNRHHAYRFLRGPFDICLAMGCANGDDAAPLADRVNRYIAIEPAEQWWSTEIGGRPAQYVKPLKSGDVPLPTSSVDLVVCLGVLHHIPNVSHVIAELSRVLRVGGTLVLREPISTMGDWRRPRRGLTANERGFPPGWLESCASGHGLEIKRIAYCLFPPLLRLAKAIGISKPCNSQLIVRIDEALSRLTQWNLHYHRDSLLKKLAPGDVVLLFQKVA